jgi:flagellar biosynthesis/type III secretory pathway M-ring protein FliF/YscJ
MEAAVDNDNSVAIVNGILIAGIVIAIILFVLVGRMNNRLRAELDQMKAEVAEELENEETIGAPRD